MGIGNFAPRFNQGPKRTAELPTADEAGKISDNAGKEKKRLAEAKKKEILENAIKLLNAKATEIRNSIEEKIRAAAAENKYSVTLTLIPYSAIAGWVEKDGIRGDYVTVKWADIVEGAIDYKSLLSYLKGERYQTADHGPMATREYGHPAELTVSFPKKN